MLYRFEGFCLSPRARELSRGETLIALRPKTLDLLVHLVQHRDRAVSREELLGAVWPHTVVTDNSVAQCIIELRRALGDHNEAPRFIRTVNRAGYRFVADVEELASAESEPAESLGLAEKTPFPTLDEAPITGRWWKFTATRGLTVPALAATTLALAAGVALLFWTNKANFRQPAESAGFGTLSLPAQRAYASGVDHSRNYRPAEAIEQFQEALRLDPGFIMARARIGWVYSVRWLFEEKGRPFLEQAYAQAYAERARLSNQDRQYIVAWYDQAHRDYPGAIRNFRQLLAEHPKETEAREELGRILLGEDRYAEARAELEKAIELDPMAAQAHNFLSAVHMATHDFPRAISEAQAFVRLQPGEPNALDTLGLAYEAANDFDAAERTYREILRTHPKFGSRIHLANTLFKMGRWREAKREIERYIADAPSDAERQWGYDQLAVIALRQGNDAEVMTYASHQPADGYHDQEVLLALRRGQLSLADQILKARPPHADRGQRANRRLELYVQGRRALAAGQVNAGIGLLAQAVAERTPMYAIDWYEDCLAAAYLQLGRQEEAIREYQRVLKIYPGLASTWLGLAKAYSAIGRDEDAKIAYSRAASVWKRADPGNSETAAVTRQRYSGRRDF